MRAFRSIVRLSALALAALALGACASQPHDKVDVSVGTQIPVQTQAKDYAALYLPYAMMATAAYSDEAVLDKSTQCPDIGLLAQRKLAKSDDDYTFHLTVRKWVRELNRRQWHCLSGRVGSLPCPAKLGKDCQPVGGLEYHVWRRMDGNRCAEVTIAFRGTDRDDLGDWISNFRWFYRLVPKFDQYAQVQDHITPIVQHIKRNCGAGAQFVSAGHSLGGGLAQQAAYADNDRSIRYVYAFDPSPVTGYFDISEWLREHNTEGLGVDRAYEQGEILVLPRLIIENFFPPAPCNPRIRSVRFNLLSGLPVSQHSIAGLTERLHAEAKKPGANPKHVEDLMQAQSCKGGPLLPLPVHIQSPA
jgi:hypothetical protein